MMRKTHTWHTHPHQSESERNKHAYVCAQQNKNRMLSKKESGYFHPSSLHWSQWICRFIYVRVMSSDTIVHSYIHSVEKVSFGALPCTSSSFFSLIDSIDNSVTSQSNYLCPFSVLMFPKIFLFKLLTSTTSILFLSFSIGMRTRKWVYANGFRFSSLWKIN